MSHLYFAKGWTTARYLSTDRAKVLNIDPTYKRKVVKNFRKSEGRSRSPPATPHLLQNPNGFKMAEGFGEWSLPRFWAL